MSREDQKERNRLKRAEREERKASLVEGRRLLAMPYQERVHFLRERGKVEEEKECTIT